MNKLAMAIHGGASEETALVRENKADYEQMLQEAVEQGYCILQKGGSAIDAVEASVHVLEDCELFNAGRGSVLNNAGDIEMDASIMDGRTLKAGAVSMVQEVKNPVTLARKIMTETTHVFLSGYGALELAKYFKLELKDRSYFITDYQYNEFKKVNHQERFDEILKKKKYGTVGAVALDNQGNLAAATSTGGTSNSLPGRIGDSCVIGAGCYADNDTCAVSGTGEGEALISGVVAHTIAMLVELNNWPLQKACDYVLHERKKPQQGEMGVISISPQGKFGIAFNTEIMKRAWIGSDEPLQVKIYRN